MSSKRMSTLAKVDPGEEVDAGDASTPPRSTPEQVHKVAAWIAYRYFADAFALLPEARDSHTDAAEFFKDEIYVHTVCSRMLLASPQKRAVSMALNVISRIVEAHLFPDTCVQNSNFFVSVLYIISRVSFFSELVLLCIEADFCTQIRIFQHFSRTTRFDTICNPLHRSNFKI